MKAELKLESVLQFLGIEGHLIIAGPCSAESEEQVMQSCEQISKSGRVHMLRAGIWKPRTRPNAFEGIGEEGLKWLVQAGKRTGLKVTTEVANARHVEQALNQGIDVLWIGARTTVNPFSVQEVADALKGVDIPVMVKNPINPDLALWIGALERINKAGITKLAAIHRGFASTEPTPFRNAPLWHFPIKLKTLVPSIEIICDPSHIAGDREIIPLISQKAIDLNMDGLMIESHMNPKIALSDVNQQLKPSALNEVLRSLVFRRPETQDPVFNNKLDELRSQIDTIDEDLIHQFANRMKIASEIGKYKKENEVTVLQVSRWNDIIKDRINTGISMGLSENFINKLLDLVHEESIRIQYDILNEGKLKNQL